MSLSIQTSDIIFSEQRSAVPFTPMVMAGGTVAGTLVGTADSTAEGLARIYKYVNNEWVEFSDYMGDAITCIYETSNRDVYACVSNVYQNGPAQIYKCTNLQIGVWELWLEVPYSADHNYSESVLCMCEYNNQIYFGLEYSPNLYRLLGQDDFEIVLSILDYEPTWSQGIEAMCVFDNALFCGDEGYDTVGYFDGSIFVDVIPKIGCCIWDFKIYDNKLWTAAESGVIYELSKTGYIKHDFGGVDSVIALAVFQNTLYIGDASGYIYTTTDGINVNEVFDLYDMFPDELDYPHITDMEVTPSGEYLYITLGMGLGKYSSSGYGDNVIFRYDGTSNPEIIGQNIQAEIEHPNSGVDALLISQELGELKSFEVAGSALISTDWTTIKIENLVSTTGVLFLHISLYGSGTEIFVRANIDDSVYYPNSTGWRCPDGEEVLIAVPANVKYRDLIIEGKASSEVTTSYRIVGSNTYHIHQ